MIPTTTDLMRFSIDGGSRRKPMTPEFLVALGSLLVSTANAVAIVLASVKLNRTATNIQKIETATNSMKDALVASTAKASHAEGRAEVEAERKAAQ